MINNSSVTQRRQQNTSIRRHGCLYNLSGKRVSKRNTSYAERKLFLLNGVILAKIEANREPVRLYKMKFTYRVMQFHHSLIPSSLLFNLPLS